MFGQTNKILIVKVITSVVFSSKAYVFGQIAIVLIRKNNFLVVKQRFSQTLQTIIYLILSSETLVWSDKNKEHNL